MPEQDAHRQQANSEAGCRRSRNQLQVLSASTFAYDLNLVPSAARTKFINLRRGGSTPAPPARRQLFSCRARRPSRILWRVERAYQNKRRKTGQLFSDKVGHSNRVILPCGDDKVAIEISVDADPLYLFLGASFSNNSVDLSSSSMAWASFLTPRWRTPIISTPRGDKASSRSKTSRPSNRGPNGSRRRCVMR